MLTFGLVAHLRRQTVGQDDTLSKLQAVVRAWHERKVARPSAQERNFHHREIVYGLPPEEVWEFQLSQTADGGGTWVTEARAYRSAAAQTDLLLTIAMRIEAATTSLAPIRYYVEPPSFLRRLRDDFEVQVGSSRANPTYEPVDTADDVAALVNTLSSDARSLPLIVVTDPVYEPPPIQNLAEKLSVALFGLAIVIHLARQATFALTNAVGKEMSCFDGGIRVYWPGWSRDDPLARHPLFLGRRVATSALHDPGYPEALIRGSLITILSRAASARFAYPKEMQTVIAAHQHRLLKAEVAGESKDELVSRLDQMAKQLADQQALADLAVSENSELQTQNEDLRHELQAVRTELKRLRAADSPAESQEDAANEEWSPWQLTDPHEALERARTEFQATLVIPDNVEVDTGLQGGILYHVLLALSRLCERERKGEAKNKRQLLRQFLSEYVGMSRDTYKVADTGVYVTDPETGKHIHLRERVHLKEGKPADTESIYWQTIGDAQSAYKYLIGRIGRHA